MQGERIRKIFLAFRADDRIYNGLSDLRIFVRPDTGLADLRVKEEPTCGTESQSSRVLSARSIRASLVRAAFEVRGKEDEEELKVVRARVRSINSM